MRTILRLLVLLLAPAPASANPKLLELPLRVRVARCDGKPVREAAWVRAQVETANRILAPHGVRLAARLDEFTPAKCVLLSAADRHTLFPHVVEGRVTVLVVARARDLSVRDYDLMGVHWRHRGRRWVILTARAKPSVLTHELGHYLGLPHDPAGGNLMTPGPSAAIWRGRQAGRVPAPFAPRLTAAQGRRVQAAVRVLLRAAAGQH